MSGTIRSDELDLMGPGALSDPYRYFARQRETDPVFWDEKYRTWIVLDHKDCLAALRDLRFSSDRINPFIERKLSGPDASPVLRSAFEVLAGWMVFKDGADHARLRGLLARAFTPKAVSSIKPRIESLTDDLIGRTPRQGEFEFISSFALQLPSIVIAEMLGVPIDDRAQFNRWSEEVAPLVSAGLEDRSRYERAAKGIDALVNYFQGLLRRYEKAPEDNLVTALLNARTEDGTLSEAEILATCTLILFGGHETTANLLANSVLGLLRHPDQFARMRDGDFDITRSVEEFLRYDGPGKAVVRVMKSDTEFAGQVLKKGQRVFLLLATANHDPAVFEDPDALRLDREGKHIAFGHGAHFCMGAALARMEAAIAVPKIVQSFPRLRLSERVLNWQPVFLTRGLTELHLHAC